MFNLTVDEAHTFYVGEKGWLVHNCNEYTTLFPRGVGAASGEVPKGYVPVSRWVDASEAKLWLEYHGTTIPPTGGAGRLYVTTPGAVRPGGTGPIRIDFYIPERALQPAGLPEWRQIFQPLQNTPIYNVTVNIPKGTTLK
jgi:filamentous hemagglutinin